MGMFKKATRKKVRARIALDGPAGSGKTFSALRAAYSFPGRNGGPPRVAVINTESGAVEKYLGLAPDGVPWEFDICELTDYAPTTYTSAIMAAGQEGYDVVVIDSLSHAWAGEGGALDIKDKKAADNRGNSFSAWREITPMHNRMIDAILRSPCHLIATMRSKMEYVMEEEIDERGRKRTVVHKVGLKPVQREGMEYEFDVFADMDRSHTLTVSKTRCPEIDGAIVTKPGADFFGKIIAWANTGTEVDPSYYAVTEADLVKLEADRKAAAANANIANVAAAAAQAPKDPRELVKRRAKATTLAEPAAAAATATASPAPTTASAVSEPAPFDTSPAAETTPTVPDNSVNAPCTRLQAEKIKTLIKDLTPYDAEIESKVNGILKGMGKGDLRELSHVEAEGLHSKLAAKYQAAFFGEAPAPATVEAPAEATSKN